MQALDSSTIAMFVFLFILLLIAWGVIRVIRGPIGSSLQQAAVLSAKLYTKAYIRCGCLTFVACANSFRESFQPLTAERASHLSWWDWAILFAAPLIAIVTNVASFLDDSVKKANDAREEEIKTDSPSVVK